ncbi:MAG: hypothetical protein A3I44_01045 [Candidatus Sungbacteria bacterium RIFCSPLOWO2_02_FULL_51_17]|uniref:Uncharacterized protein n=1 Tax=Candidatus Sungbacteria bacterium RIFCSPHIGHO2_02_FULL_51_29 TaxID=1802273 RepID=A0A1G2KWN7_9BACT|nr:MAG: hypothetical protein A2676_00445 [Candidatus Sungbacteria bacterium RIFCSPHIGHO2_01_FULL_51_22]OHA03808.1 MAG: hypothetical protein A3C16_05115 [Candidatus Sungbacteria bacterium RIFCSPHIGHO2_02_FULL_51_29]OHA07452.1 MAG: hypothetical protein A3B29_02200 [Candidatus Sungbacteria bacterium RIFCSPLOWO2_01_FULL_51_34]OHA10964.1 MAG: hypothetical protein A3I44_01045 [Candidatus Sungbacteria bacterium RIFCSPLOWO2_02_FULL_51_17]
MRRPDFLYHIGKSLRHVLHDKKILGVFAVMAPVMFLVMFFLPIKAIPGNDVAFQLLFFGTRDYILLAVFSFFGALVIAMQVAVFRQHGVSHAGSGSLAGGAGVMSALFSVFFATSVCVLCAGALFGFVGFGVTLFLSSHRWYVVGISAILLAFSFLLSAERLGGECDTCRADASSLK